MQAGIGLNENALDAQTQGRRIHGELKSPEDQSHSDWRTVAVCFFLATIVWAVFGQTVHYEFVNYDDPGYVYQNPAITQGLNWHGIVWTFTHVNVGTWFPLTDISHQLDWQLYGLNAGGHHLTNVLLHAATVILLFLVLRKMTGLLWPSAFVAAVFAIHPLRVESVAWVAERKDVLSGFFFMLTLWAWARYVKKRSQVENGKLNAISAGAALDYCLVLAFFALGLMSKSMLVTLPFVLLLLDYWPLNRLSSVTIASRPLFRAWLGLILEKIPFLLLSAATCVVTVLTQKNAIVIAQSLTFPWRVGNALLAYTDYLGHMIYPVGLAVAYTQSETNPSIGRIILSALILISISLAVVVCRRKHPYLVVGWLWYLGMLLPVIDIMQVAQNARADRYTYLPQIGLYILMTWGAVEFCSSWRYRRAMLGFFATAILAGLLADAYIQTTYWKNSITLWTRSLACTAENSFAYNTIGSALVAQKKWDEAIQNFERALQIKPDYAEAEVNLGVALVNLDKRDEAIPHFLRALQINPYSADAHYNLGDALATQGKQQEAVQHFERALQFKPDFPAAHYDLGLALAMQGKWPEAIQHFDQALRFKLDDTDARYILAVALATEKKWGEAIELYKQVLQAKPDFAEAQNNLAIALAAQGKSAEADQHFQQALKLAIAQGNTPLAETIRTRLKSYQSALPQSQTP
jgi:protein O-mannosyl-transferase